MKATKKQIAEVTELAIAQGVEVCETLATFEIISSGDYKFYGPKCVIEAAVKIIAARKDGRLFDHSKGLIPMIRCTILAQTEKAMLLESPGLFKGEKWVLKSIIDANNYSVPMSAVR